MSHKLEKEFMDGIGQAAATEGKFIPFIIAQFIK
jgi:hypothetical protein